MKQNFPLFQKENKTKINKALEYKLRHQTRSSVTKTKYITFSTRSDNTHSRSCYSPALPQNVDQKGSGFHV